MEWQRLSQRRVPQGIQGSVMSSEESSCLHASMDSLEQDSIQGRPGANQFVDRTPHSGMCFWVMSGEVQLSVTRRGMSKKDKAMNWLGRQRGGGGHNASQSLWDDELQPSAPSQNQLVTKNVGTVLHGQPLCGFSSGLAGALEACTTTAASGAEIFCIEAAMLQALPDPWPERIRTAWRRVEAHRSKQIGTARHDNENVEDDTQMSMHRSSKRDKGPWTIMKSQWLKRKIFGSETSQRVSWLSKAHKQVSPKYTPADWDKGAKKPQGNESRTSSWKGSHSLSMLSSDGGHSSQLYASRLLDICLGEDEQDPGRPQPTRHRSQKARKRGTLTAQDVRPGSGPFFERPISSAGQSLSGYTKPPHIEIAKNQQPSSRLTALAA